jgi:hypothetical protein
MLNDVVDSEGRGVEYYQQTILIRLAVKIRKNNGDCFGLDSKYESQTIMRKKFPRREQLIVRVRTVEKILFSTLVSMLAVEDLKSFVRTLASHRL